MSYYLKQFAANYDCNAYGSGDYNSEACATTATDTSGELLPTGANLTIGLVGGILLVTLAIVLLVRTLRRKKSTN